MPSEFAEFENPEAALSRLLKDNPDLAPQLIESLKSKETEAANQEFFEAFEAAFGPVDNDPVRMKYLFADFVQLLHERRTSRQAPEQVTQA